MKLYFSIGKAANFLLQLAFKLHFLLTQELRHSVRQPLGIRYMRQALVRLSAPSTVRYKIHVTGTCKALRSVSR